ncbi:MAG: hypothetical protein BRC23_00510 [Parcubacteria group bacterium SW_4_49_11]|nr:MAG: hypothetical protein BRC23_00510 [Parcubacteria group bacterium SW_4_49_11]
MPIGGHVSISGGYAQAAKRVANIGGDVLQMFSASPRGWNFPELSDEEREAFFQTREEKNIAYAYFHASYLINLADTGKTGEMSRRLMTRELGVASEVGVRGSVVHVGSFKDKKAEPELSTQKYEPVLEKLRDILANTPDDTMFIIENMGTRKIGVTLEEIGWIIHQIGDERLGVCLDTCHLHAGGYDITSEENLDEVLTEADKQFGLDRLECLHINDSRDEFESYRDRHENLGEGYIDTSAFTALLNDSRTKELPMILETPGFEGKGPDERNVEILRGLQ